MRIKNDYLQLKNMLLWAVENHYLSWARLQNPGAALLPTPQQIAGKHLYELSLFVFIFVRQLNIFEEVNKGGTVVH